MDPLSKGLDLSGAALSTCFSRHNVNKIHSESPVTKIKSSSYEIHKNPIVKRRLLKRAERANITS